MAEDTRKLIFQLEINNNKLGIELATINDRLKNATDNQKAWNKELIGLREGTAEYAKAAKNAALAGDSVRKLKDEAKAVNQALKISDAVPGSYNELKASIALTRNQLDNLKIGSEDYIKTEAKLNNLLGQEIEIRTAQKSLFQERVKGAINESDATQTLTQQYKALQLQLQELAANGKDGTDEFTKLAMAAGAVKDNINKSKDAAKTFATGSNLEQFGNVLGNIKGDLLNLDFGGASEKAKQLAEVSKSITFAGAVGSIKELSSTLVTLGKALITNPLFIIGAVIAAVGVALFQLNKRAEENKKAFDDASKSLDEYEAGLGRLKNTARDSADALALSQGKITEDGLARKKVLDKLNDDTAESYQKLQDKLTELRKNKNLTDEALDILERRAIKAQAEEVKLINEAAQKDLEKIRIDAIVKKADEDLAAYEKKKEEDDKRAKEISGKQKARAKELRDIEIDSQKEAEKDAEKMLADYEKLKEEELKLEQFFNNEKENLRKKDFDNFVKELTEATALKDEYLNTQFQNEIQREKDKQEIVKENTALSEAEKQAIIEASEKKITEIKNRQINQRLSAAQGAFASLSQLEEAFGTKTKVGASAQALIQTYLGATSAYASLASIPVAGPALGAVAAGLAIASGLANVAKINGVQFYDGGYTQKGNPREVATNLGVKPYTYHKNEYVVPNKVLSTPEGARHVQLLETMRTGRGVSHTGIRGYFDGGFASRSATDSVDSQIQQREDLINVISQQKIFVAVEDINTGQQSVSVIDSRNTI